MEIEKEKKNYFLHVEIICEQNKFTTTIYGKPVFSGVDSNLEQLLPSAYKFGMVYTLVFIFARMDEIPLKINFLKKIFCKNGYPPNFIDTYFKGFLDNTHLVKENVATEEKNILLLVLPFFGIIFL